MRGPLRSAVLLALACGACSTSTASTGRAAAQGGEPRPREASRIDDGSERTPAQQKISSRLWTVMRAGDAEDAATRNAVRRAAIELDEDGRALVDIDTEVTEGVLDEIERLGGIVVSSFANFRAVRARMPLSSLETLAGMAEIRQIRPADAPITNQPDR